MASPTIDVNAPFVGKEFVIPGDYPSVTDCLAVLESNVHHNCTITSYIEESTISLNEKHNGITIQSSSSSSIIAQKIVSDRCNFSLKKCRIRGLSSGPEIDLNASSAYISDVEIRGNSVATQTEGANISAKNSSNVTLANVDLLRKVNGILCISSSVVGDAVSVVNSKDALVCRGNGFIHLKNSSLTSDRAGIVATSRGVIELEGSVITGGGWGGYGNGGDIIIHSSSSVTGTNYDGLISFPGSRITLTNSTVQNCAGYGVRATGGIFLLDSNTFSNVGVEQSPNISSFIEPTLASQEEIDSDALRDDYL